VRKRRQSTIIPGISIWATREMKLSLTEKGKTTNFRGIMREINLG
jgi:hypothetical protein